MRSFSLPTGLSVRATSARRAGKVAAALGIALAVVGCKAHIPASTPLKGSVEVSQPPAYADLCQRHAQLCDVPVRASAPAEVMLDETTFQEIQAVNQAVNRAIRYRSDAEVYGRAEFWTVAAPGDSGDCEDLALAKLQRLLHRGFPREAMRLAIVHRPRDGIRHAVLTVETDRGTYVLDSSYNRIHAWADLPYTNWMWEQPGRDRWSLAIDGSSQTAALR